MKRGIAVLLSLSAVVAVGYFTASKWAIRHETLMFHDTSRSDRPVEIDVAVRRDRELQANAGMIKLPVVILNTLSWQISLPPAAIWSRASSMTSQPMRRL